ncbi:MAG: DUF5050 domain-containing protein [Clostridia bacterium]|nr:DUF5050 domain-containing protein [Clostridia bacterium]
MERNKKIALIPFLAAVIFSLIVIGVELIVPLDKLHTASDEEFQNTSVGGKVCISGNTAYYLSSSGKIRMNGKNIDIKIADSGSKMQSYDDGIIYMDENELITCDMTGANKQTVIKNVGEYFLSGNWIFYTEKGSRDLKKIRITDKKSFDLGIKVNGQFTVRGNTLLFIGDKNYLYSARTDGSNLTAFLGKRVDFFMFYGNYIYFLQDGKIWSTVTHNTASMYSYCEADSFTIYDDTLYYISEGTMYSRDLTETEAPAVKIETKGENPTEIYVSEKHLYYYLADGTLYRCDHFGAGAEKM